jgi:DNA-nicking Smr family endonuclease
MNTETTPTMQIKQNFDRKLEQIRNHPDYSADARRRYIAEAAEAAEAEYRESIQAQEQQIQERVEKAEQAVFENRYPYATSDVEKAQLRAARRGAYEFVYRSAPYGKDPGRTQEELTRLLERAERTGDPELATAVYHVATERGIRDVADSYLETRPDERKRWEGYVAARTEADSLERKLGHAMGFGLMKPPELDANFGGSPAAMRG